MTTKLACFNKLFETHKHMRHEIKYFHNNINTQINTLNVNDKKHNVT